MTRSKKLKKVIRQRARKTGERYTAARRQVLLGREARNAGSTPPVAATRKDAPVAPAPAPAPAASAPRKGTSTRSASTRGGLSESAVLKRTGKGLDHWFAVLDAFGATAKGHTATARHLYDAHGVPGWHAQGIAVAYERARGVRAMNQACDGKFQVSVSRVVKASVAEVARALSLPSERARWLRHADAALARILGEAFEGPKPRTVTIKDAANARLRFRWDRSTVEIRITGKPGGGASVVADNVNLSGPDEVEARRAQWKVALDGLKAHVGQ